MMKITQEFRVQQNTHGEEWADSPIGHDNLEYAREHIASCRKHVQCPYRLINRTTIIHEEVVSDECL